MKQFIVNADDLGLCRATNRAISEAYQRGILTSASVMVNGPAFEDALETVIRPNPGLGVGLHVCLTGAKSLLSPERIPLLVDRDGEFCLSFLSLLRHTVSHRRVLLGQIEDEVSAQFEVLEAHGVAVDHVDSHCHYHMIPAVFEVIARLARYYNCPAIRLSHEPISDPCGLLFPSRLPRLSRNLTKKLVLSTMTPACRRHADGLLTPDSLVGVLDSGTVDARVIRRAAHHARDGVTEIVTHPSAAGAELRPGATSKERAFVQSPDRCVEFQALVDPSIRASLESSGAKLVRYTDLLEPPSERQLSAQQIHA